MIRQRMVKTVGTMNVFCQPARVDTLIVNGRVVIEGGRLLTMDLDEIQREHRAISQVNAANRVGA